MAKCSKCGINFDYDNFYGICPKCGVYNKENQTMPQTLPAQGKKSSSAAPIVGFICIMAGLILGITLPIVFVSVNVINLMKMDGSEVVFGSRTEDLSEYQQEGEETETQTREIVQSPTVVTVNPGEPYFLGEQTQCQFLVQSARIISNPDASNQQPGYHLVAIDVSYENPNMDMYFDYEMSDKPYIGISDGGFRECLDKYQMEEYPELISGLNMLDLWDVSKDFNGDGVFLAYIPTGVTEITFYMDSRQENTNDILTIYAVPLTIEAGEGL